VHSYSHVQTYKCDVSAWLPTTYQSQWEYTSAQLLILVPADSLKLDSAPAAILAPTGVGPNPGTLPPGMTSRMVDELPDLSEMLAARLSEVSVASLGLDQDTANTERQSLCTQRVKVLVCCVGQLPSVMSLVCGTLPVNKELGRSNNKELCVHMHANRWCESMPSFFLLLVCRRKCSSGARSSRAALLGLVARPCQTCSPMSTRHNLIKQPLTRSLIEQRPPWLWTRCCNHCWGHVSLTRQHPTQLPQHGALSSSSSSSSSRMYNPILRRL
jgi:hypothetical protein